MSARFIDGGRYKFVNSSADLPFTLSAVAVSCCEMCRPEP